ncbi:mitochondrial ATP synthase delta subunit, putative [Plasmodium ovale wallikeri]|uniref:Mitochondrial ATP synthase delta subunit, putative n=2 Tax=Plasmodium ovale TaxID=36330 RepID=A0A1A8ZTC9_PLAOA|nr:mitochondrial ATP synthase delta subunit, putative [Plasmodium ovale wallikeri]SBT47655.1 mitochondrial ATP synthase delta subunit, putative [Plasmodium ovale wallikeri]SBT82266.1 mitochondrial ATP synthase delta subunit, putative [Plasmodium ovale]
MKAIRYTFQFIHLRSQNKWKHFSKNDFSIFPFCKIRNVEIIKNNKVYDTIRYYSNKSEEEKIKGEEYYLSMGDNIEKRYSLALYNIAKKNNKIKEISSDILFIKNNFLKDKTFLTFLHTPNIDNKNKLTFLKNECKKYNNNFNNITENFLESLFDSKRINFLQKIIQEFELLLMRDRKEIKCIVYTAKDIDNNYKKKINEAIILKLKNELKPLVEFKTDKNILGGLVLQIGNQIFDFSAKSKIEKIRSTLL